MSRIEQLGYKVARRAMLADPGVHYTLMDAITAFDKMDPVDALKDADALLALQEQRCQEMGLLKIGDHARTR